MAEWEVYAVKYAERADRTRADSFIFDDHHDVTHPMDYFLWVLRQGDRVIVVDAGYDAAEAGARGRPILMEPGAALAPLGIRPDEVQTLIVTHLHYDHAGGLAQFPAAHLHMQAAEMAYATGPCMCHDTLRMPFTGAHICEAVMRLYSGKLTFHDGDAEITDGVTVHRLGGHSRGLQCVRVRTAAGWLVLASDGAHFYENVTARKPFPIVVDMQDMLDGFATIDRLASSPGLIVPGHDPLVMQRFAAGPAAHIRRLDKGPLRAGPLD